MLGFGRPLDVRPLVAVERAALARLLGAVTPEQWSAPTACPGWDVRDLVAHLVHDVVRRLSGGRDGQLHPLPPGDGLGARLAAANEAFVVGLRDASPAVLVDLLGHLGDQLDRHWAGLDPTAVAEVDVSWAGPHRSPVWLDLGRELTEHWIHRQQIALAVGATDDGGTPQVDAAVVAVLARGLLGALDPHPAVEGTRVRLDVVGAAGGSWTAVRAAGTWLLTEVGAEAEAEDAPAAATVTTDAETFWRVAARLVEPQDVADRVQLAGDPVLAGAAAALVSVVRQLGPSTRTHHTTSRAGSLGCRSTRSTPKPSRS